jgi:hypothetical protein
MRRRRSSRRGFVLLIVLSLLILSLVLVVTFFVVASQYRRAAVSSARKGQLGSPPRRQLNSALYQVLRDTRSRGSAVRFHSLLRDAYGEDGYRGRLAASQVLMQVNEQSPTAGTPLPTGASKLSNGQFIDLAIDTSSQTLASTDGQPYTMSALPGFYNGCVLTVISGRAAGRSTRIVGSLPLGSVYILRILPFSTNLSGGDLWAALGDAVFLVNGRVFNGTGVGFRYHDAAQHTVKVAKLDGTTPVSTGGQTVDLSVALLPNHASRPVLAPQQPQAELLALLNGGSDESYDAADYQNMFLALVKPAAQVSRDILPSFHRPELVNYWKHQPSAAPGSYWADDNFKRLVSLRPVEPNFDGSNPNYDDVAGPWDVDNDGDGVPDSVWVDLGFPDETAANGRRYRPLFAILCVDLDGRLNVNSHGNPTAFYAARPGPVFVAAGTTQGFPKGLGYGPPEISLSGMINRSDLLFGQRYGTDAVPGVPGLDLLAGIKHFTEPQNYFSGAGGRSAYANPPDLRGELAYALDVFGQPVFEQIPRDVLDARADSPYEINLIDRPNADAPFTVSELEAIQRRWDIDSRILPRRLLDLVDLTPSENARLLTTDSYDPPVPGILIPNELRRTFADAGLPNARHVAELMASRLNPGVNVNIELTKLLSPDLALGLRMDINRPFGNDRDDNGNGIVDEPGEQFPEYVWNQKGSPLPFASVADFKDVRCHQTNGFDANGDGIVDGQDSLFARQLFARHLYVLMMTLIDHGPAGPDPSVARQVAQWAVNVVDFRDADSIMTSFEYPLNPFLGWMVDGDPRTNEGSTRDVVWGCERPEALITETLAFHDRRTEDRDDDNGPKTKIGPNDGKEQDPDFDQRLRPRGAFFVELFNPVTSPTTLRPAELDAGAASGGIDLVKVASDGLVKSPVWRLLFVKDGAAGKDPDDPNGTITEETRRIYFINPALVGPTVPPLDLSGEGGDFWTTLPVAVLAPGQYAVVGSAGIRQGNDYVSPVGRLATTTTMDEQDYQSLKIGQTRRIVLSPMASGNQVHVYDNGLDPAAAFQVSAPYPADPGAMPPGPPNDQDILPASAIVIDLPRSLSISEPLQGYTDKGFDSSATLEGFYTPVRDKPLDQANDLRLMKNQTTTWGMIHLQRLADPTRPYHAAANPYRTIDSQRCDLTAFNGASSSQDPDSAGKTCLYAVQRGDTRTQRELWPQEPFSAADPTQDWSRDPNSTHYFSFYLRCSLGYLNHGFWPFQGATAGLYRGAPALDAAHNRVFSWLAWNNRPFISQYELLQVPADQSSQMLRNHSLPLGSSPYDTLSPSPQYGQLLNFFHASPSNRVGSARNFHRLFEYVEVPSRYVGTETVLNPAWFGKPNALMADPTSNPVVNPRLPDPSKQTCNPSFLPPFNRVSRFRDPGRININTVYDRKVWEALLGGFVGCPFEAMVASRRGCGGLVGDLIPSNLDANFPSCVANPFRPAGSGSLVPLAHLERQDIETTLLRSGARPSQPTDANYPKAPSPSSDPLLEGGFVAANPVATDPRNSAFRYNILHRLGNMVTTRSNVYAVWITIGYFEVEPNEANGTVVSDAFHGDGCRVAQEIGRETGEIQRHRAFYLIDRSLPVAFEPGENHNVDRCILVSRYIE